MRILTLENECFLLNNLPEVLEDDVRFSVLDNSDPKDPDFYFMPLIFLESFSSPAMLLEIAGNEIMMPIDWNLAVGDAQSGNDLEILPLTSINDRGFDVFLFNPLTSFKYEFEPVTVKNIFNDVKWYFPKMKNGQLLSVPITEGDNPLCAFFFFFFSRQSETIDFANLL